MKSEASIKKGVLVMPVKVLIPTPLRPYTDQKEAVEIEGARVRDLLDNLTERYRDLRKHLFADSGTLRSFVNVYVNEDDIRSLDRFETAVSEKDVVSIVPSIAGGAASPAVVEGEVSFSKEEIQRYSRHLIMPEVGMEGQAKLKNASVLMVGAGGLVAPLGMYLAAAGIGRLGLGRGPAEAPGDERASFRDQPPYPHRRLRDAPLLGERARPFPRLRSHRRRHRQLPHAIPRERRLCPLGKTQRLRQHLPLRRPGLGLRRPPRALLPLPLSRAAPSGARPELRRGRCPRCSSRNRRVPSGTRGLEAGARARRAHDRPTSGLRRSSDEIPRAPTAEGPRLPDLRRAAADPRAHRLRRVLWYTSGARSGEEDGSSHDHRRRSEEAPR